MDSIGLTFNQCLWNSASGPAGCQTVQHLRSTRPRAVWLLMTECHDPGISAFSLTGGFEIPGLKVLRDYISEGICDDGSWQVLLSSGWRDSSERPRCTGLQRIASVKIYKDLTVPRYFIISCGLFVHNLIGFPDRIKLRFIFASTVSRTNSIQSTLKLQYQ